MNNIPAGLNAAESARAARGLTLSELATIAATVSPDGGYVTNAQAAATREQARRNLAQVEAIEGHGPQ